MELNPQGAPRPLFASGLFRRCALSVLLLFVGAFLSPKLSAYYLAGQKWPVNSNVTWQVGLGAAPRTLIDGNVSWNTAALPAFGSWNGLLQRVQFIGLTTPGLPSSSGDGVNGVVFASSVFGQSFGSSTLAVTYYRYSGSTMTEADVLFNTAQSFDSYRGPLRFGSGGKVIADLRRVLIHELGHALGLGHPDGHGQSIDAIMNSITSNRELPSSDDTAGGQSLYGTPVPASLKIQSSAPDENGYFVLQCVGARNAINRVEASSTLSPNSFVTVGSVMADANGLFNFTDINAPDYPQRFYRVAYP